MNQNTSPESHHTLGGANHPKRSTIALVGTGLLTMALLTGALLAIAPEAVAAPAPNPNPVLIQPGDRLPSRAITTDLVAPTSTPTVSLVVAVAPDVLRPSLGIRVTPTLGPVDAPSGGSGGTATPDPGTEAPESAPTEPAPTTGSGPTAPESTTAPTTEPTTTAVGTTPPPAVVATGKPQTSIRNTGPQNTGPLETSPQQTDRSSIRTASKDGVRAFDDADSSLSQVDGELAVGPFSAPSDGEGTGVGGSSTIEIMAVAMLAVVAGGSFAAAVALRR